MTAEEIEMELRREWWMNHGHSRLYGDDGEMQCGMCPADFKRDPLDDLREITFAARARRTADLIVEGSDDKLMVSPGTFVQLLGIANRMDCTVTAALDEVMREYEVKT